MSIFYSYCNRKIGYKSILVGASLKTITNEDMKNLIDLISNKINE